MDERTKREVHESDLLAFQEQYHRAHYPAACSSSTPDALPVAATGGAPVTARVYTPASLVVCKIANWPIGQEISTESFYTRPVRLSLQLPPCIASASQLASDC